MVDTVKLSHNSADRATDTPPINTPLAVLLVSISIQLGHCVYCMDSVCVGKEKASTILYKGRGGNTKDKGAF